jgi:hypothetical protein
MNHLLIQCNCPFKLLRPLAPPRSMYCWQSFVSLHFTQSNSRYHDPPPTDFDGALGSRSNVGSDSFIQDSEPLLPPIYNIIRANKNRNMAAGELGTVFGQDHEGIDKSDGIQMGGGLISEGDNRGFKAQNYHLAEKGLNVSMSVSKPNNDTDAMNCLACTETHSFAERMGGKLLPVLIVLSDQCFAPILLAGEGHCPIIVRVEDGTLQEICDVFMDRFKAFSAPHGALPR